MNISTLGRGEYKKIFSVEHWGGVSEEQNQGEAAYEEKKAFRNWL